MRTPTAATASSNADEATNVFTNNNTVWESSGSIREAPVWIEVSFSQAVVAEQMLVDFYTAASLLMNSTVLPRRVYLFGSNNGQNWYHLSSFNVSAVNGTEVLVATSLDPYPFDRYRLAMENGHLGVRRWEIYTGQICSCGDNNGEMYLGVDPLLGGYKTTQDWLDSIAYELDNTDPGVDCVATNNCTIQILPGQFAEVSNDGVCEDAIYVASELGVSGQTVLLSRNTLDLSSALFVNYTSFVFGSSVSQV